MIGKKLGFRKILILLFSLFLCLALVGTVFGTSGGGRGGGDGGSGGDTSGSVFGGYTPEQLREIYGYGFRGSSAGDTVDIGTPPPGSTGPQKGGQWSDIQKIPSGLPEFTKREQSQMSVDYNTAEAERQMEKSKDYENKEKGAKVLSVGCTILSGIGGAVGGATVVAITIVGDGLATGGQTYVESRNKGDSAGKSLLKATAKGGAKMGVSAITSKINTGSKVADTVIGIGAGMGYDEVSSEGGSSAPDSSPKQPPVYAPMSGSGGLGIDPVPKAM